VPRNYVPLIPPLLQLLYSIDKDLTRIVPFFQSREWKSYTELKAARYARTPSPFHPRDKYIRPVLSSQEIGWDAGLPSHYTGVGSVRHVRGKSEITNFQQIFKHYYPDEAFSN